MKRTIFWLIPIGLLICLVVYFWPQNEITDHEYIDYVKASTHENTTYEQLMAKNCAENNWVYFETNRRQDVVEFKGTCTVDNKQKPINLQFVVDADMKDLNIGAMLVAEEKVEEQKRDDILATFLQ